MTATYIICLRERVCVCERERERKKSVGCKKCVQKRGKVGWLKSGAHQSLRNGKVRMLVGSRHLH